MGQQQGIEAQAANSPLSPHFVNAPSPPPAASNVRRHVSLTYGAGVGGPRKMNPSTLRRSGTLQATAPVNTRIATPPDTTESVEEDEYGYEVEEDGAYDDEYAEYMQQQGQGQQFASSPGSAGWTPGNEWRAASNSGFSNSGGNGGNQNAAIDEVQRALSALEIASNNNNNLSQMYQNHQNIGNYQAGQSSHPPRFNPTHPPPSLTPGLRNGGSNGNNGNGGRALDTVADLEGRKTPQAQSGASNYIQQQQYQQQQDSRNSSSRGSWDQKDRMLGNRISNPNLQYGYQQAGKGDSGSGAPNVPPIPQQFLQQQPRMTGGSSFSQGGGGQQQGSGSGLASGPALMTTPVDLPTLVATKGYNPANFDTRPQFVR